MEHFLVARHFGTDIGVRGNTIALVSDLHCLYRNGYV